MLIDNYFIKKEDDLSDYTREELGLNEIEDYVSITKTTKRIGGTIEETAYYTEDEFKEILELGLNLFKGRKLQEEEYEKGYYQEIDNDPENWPCNLLDWQEYGKEIKSQLEDLSGEKLPWEIDDKEEGWEVER